MSLTESKQWIDFRQGDLVEALNGLSLINSGTHIRGGLVQMEAACSKLFTPVSDSVEVIASQTAKHADLQGHVYTQQYRNILSFKKRSDAPVQALLAGHQDTVFPKDHSFQSPVQTEANIINGPGVAAI